MANHWDFKMLFQTFYLLNFITASHVSIKWITEVSEPHSNRYSQDFCRK